MLPSANMPSQCGRTRTALVVSSIIVLLLCQVGLVANAEIRLKFKRDQTAISVRGQFTSRRSERYYTVSARAGQHMRVEIIPLTVNLNTVGNVKYPHNKLELGNPGGVVLDEDLPEDGVYRIRVGQRFNEKKVGRFILKVSIR
jgi:hypothetical protein